MIAKFYGIFDSVQCEYIQTFSSKNDDDAKRTADGIVRTQGFDKVLYKDRSIHHLYDLDTATGRITNNDIYQLLNFATAIESAKQESLELAVQQKLLTEDFKKELKDYILLYLKGEIHEEKESSAS